MTDKDVGGTARHPAAPADRPADIRPAANDTADETRDPRTGQRDSWPELPDLPEILASVPAAEPPAGRAGEADRDGYVLSVGDGTVPLPHHREPAATASGRTRTIGYTGPMGYTEPAEDSESADTGTAGRAAPAEHAGTAGNAETARRAGNAGQAEFGARAAAARHTGTVPQAGLGRQAGTAGQAGTAEEAADGGATGDQPDEADFPLWERPAAAPLPGPGPAPRPVAVPLRPRRPVVGLPLLLVLALLAAFFGWVGAEPFWIAVGHAERGSLVVTDCTGQGITKRCTGEFTATGHRQPVRDVALSGAAASTHPGTRLDARMAAGTARTAYVGDGLGLLLRWAVPLGLILLLGLLIAGATGAWRLRGRHRFAAVVLSLLGPLALAAGIAAVAW